MYIVAEPLFCPVVADLACPLGSMAKEDSSTEMAQRTRSGRKKDVRKKRRGAEELGRTEDVYKDEGGLCPPPANSGKAAPATAANWHTYATSGWVSTKFKEL